MRDTKVQWHPGFIAAMNLELAPNRGDLIFEREYNLNSKPLEIDLLVIKKEVSVNIDNEIGKLFKGHNIIEFKSPEDHLDIDTFYKSGAYASLYKSYGKTVDAIKADDITVSIIREAKPVELFRYFKEHGIAVTNSYRGIYYIGGGVLFLTQIIDTGELDKAAHIWLGSLSRKLKKQDMVELLNSVKQMSEKEDRELADSVLEVSMEANKQVIEELMGDDKMNETLMEMMEPRIRQRVNAQIEEERKNSIQITINTLVDFGHEKEEIKMAIIKNYGLSAEEVEEYL